MQPSSLREHPLFSASQTIANDIALARPITRQTLNTAMEAAYGESNETGAWTQRHSFEALEAALALTAPQLISTGDADAAIKALTEIEGSLPTHTVRSEEQITLQQFSTPPSIAFLCAHLANPTADDILLEPSAGTGQLATYLRRDGRQPHLVAADVYRPAAVDQIKTLGKQINVPVYDEGTNAKPADIAVRGVKAAAEAGPMQTDSSAMPTCLRLRSTVECTATVLMPNAWQARRTRSAISPRLAMTTLSSMYVPYATGGCC